ncbi:MAG: insulinase family protein [Candidatus Cloacimonetes bacterium]|nr:insulinase family protein [Candidatus Cloacimonadota bacterium]
MFKRTFLTIVLTTIVFLLFSQSFSTIQQDVQKFTLSNGATLLVLPRTTSPIIHCVTLVDVGAVREVPGITGISHYLEHMAFKGTETIGTNDFEAEKLALKECHRIFDEILAERAKGSAADPERLSSLEAELAKAIDVANEYVIDNEFSRIMDLNGSNYLNAGTSYDLTMYTVSLPSNKLELWMLMEADRFTNPVFRQFYQERDVILEEKRMGESTPIGRFSREFMQNAFVANPYRNVLIGTEEDIRNLTEKKLRDYFNRYYGAQNLVFTVVGDVDPDVALSLANDYLVTIPEGTKNEPVVFNEPDQTAERLYIHEDIGQPFIMIGYHIPHAAHPDFPVFNVIADILGQGRTSRLHRALVEDNNLAAYSYSYAGAPGRIYDNLFIIAALPLQGIDTENCLLEIDLQIELMKNDLVTADELAGVKRRTLKRSIDRLRSGLGLSIQLAMNESLYGDYNELFRDLEKIEQITREDIKRVMNETFVPENRIIGILENKER